MSSPIAPNAPHTELTLVRVFAAPREKVWRAWTDAEHVRQWFSPKHFTNPVCEWSAKEGDAIDLHMQAPDGTRHPMGGVFEEVTPQDRLVFTSTAFTGADGVPELEARNTVTFEDADGGKTKLTLHAQILRATPAMAGPLSGQKEGWSQSLDKLDALLAS